MAERSHSPGLVDIVTACARVRRHLEDLSLEEFEADWLSQWVVERGIEIISEASRHLPADMKARHPGIPWPKVAGIGNVLRHNYERISPPLLWTLVNTELPILERACRAELGSGPTERP
jgi:uncharacterized protein with HEPN domain